MLIECRMCKAYVEAENVGEFRGSHYESEAFLHYVKYILLKCKRCENPILVSRDLELEADPEEDQQEFWGVPFIIYPQPNMRVNPKTPPFIRNAAQEAIICFNAKAYTASAIMCRKTLESVCRAHNIKEGNLALSLKLMLEKDVIDKRLYEWSDNLRIADNEAVHEDNAAFSIEDANDILYFMIAIIDYLFSYRDQFEMFKSRRIKKVVSS